MGEYDEMAEGVYVDENTELEFDPSEEVYAYLKRGGRYGQGQDLGGDVELIKCVLTCSGSGVEGPGYDRTIERAPDYAKWTFKVSGVKDENGDEGPEMFLTKFFERGPGRANKTMPWLKILGIVEDPQARTVSQAAVNAKLPRHCGIEVGDPKQDKKDKEKWYNGELRTVIGF